MLSVDTLNKGSKIDFQKYIKFKPEGSANHQKEHLKFGEELKKGEQAFRDAVETITNQLETEEDNSKRLKIINQNIKYLSILYHLISKYARPQTNSPADPKISYDDMQHIFSMFKRSSEILGVTLDINQYCKLLRGNLLFIMLHPEEAKTAIASFAGKILSVDEIKRLIEEDSSSSSSDQANMAA